MDSSQRHNALSFLTGAAFLLAFFVAAGGLFLKYHLDNAREFSLDTLKAHTGIDFNVESVKTEGLRSLALEGVSLSLPLSESDKLFAHIERIHFALSIPAMIQGHISVGDAVLEGALVTLKQAEERKSSKITEAKLFNLADILEKLPFQKLVGNECAFEVMQGDRNLVSFEDISFSLVNDSAKEALLLTLATALVTPEEKGSIRAKGQVQLPGLVNGEISFDGINSLLARHFVDLPDGVEGALSGSVHLSGDTDQALLFDTKIDLKQIALPQLPLTLDPLEGQFHSIVQWLIAAKEIQLLRSQLESNLLCLDLNGRIDLASDEPELAINARAQQLPYSAVLAEYLPRTLNRIGKPEIELGGEAELQITLSGPLRAPLLFAEAFIPEIRASLSPSNKQYPECAIEIEQVRASWDSESKEPSVFALVTGGNIKAAAFGFEVERLSGALSLKEQKIRLHPFTARLSEKICQEVLSMIWQARQANLM